MEIKETYHFLPRDFDINGKRVSDGNHFREILKEFECDFHARHSNYYALFLFANTQTMLLLSRSCNAKENMIYGMDLIGVDSDFEPNINHLIEEASNRKNIVVYGIDSAFMLPDKNGIPKIDEEKMIYPLTLLIDNNMKDGMLYLKYLDDDNENGEDCLIPINVDEKQIKWK